MTACGGSADAATGARRATIGIPDVQSLSCSTSNKTALERPRPSPLRIAPQTDPDRLASLAPAGRTLLVDKDQPIYAEGEPATFCYRILGGCVRMVKLIDDGRRQVTEFLLPEDLFGLDMFDAHDLTAEAVIPTTVCRYRRAALEALADRDPAVARGLRSFAAHGLRTARGQMMLLGRTTAMERIATFLLEMTARAPRPGQDRVALPMGRADIADYLGLTTETICRVLACLRESGTIATSRGPDGTSVTIHDLAALQTLASAELTRAGVGLRSGRDGDPLAPLDALIPPRHQGWLRRERVGGNGPPLAVTAIFLAQT